MQFSPQDVFIHGHRHCLFQARRECTFCTEGSFRCRSRKHRAALSSVSPADRDGKSRGPHWGRDHQEGASSLLNYFCDKIDFLQFFTKHLLASTCKFTIFLNLKLFTVTPYLPPRLPHTHTLRFGIWWQTDMTSQTPSANWRKRVKSYIKKMWCCLAINSRKWWFWSGQTM